MIWITKRCALIPLRIVIEIRLVIVIRLYAGLPHLSDVPYPRMVPRHQQATSPLRCALSPHGTTSSAGYLTSPMCPIPAWYHVISRLPHLSDVPYPRMVPRHQQATSPLRCALSPHGTTSSAGYLTSPMCPIPAWYHVMSRLPHLSDVPYPRMVPRHQQGYLISPMCPIPAWYHVISRLPHLSDVPYPRMVPRHQQATSPLRCALSPHGTTSSAGYLTSPMCPIPAWYHVISRLPHLSDVPYPRMVPRHQQATSPLRCALSPHGTTSSAGYLTSPMCPIPHGTTSSAGYLTSPMCPIPAWYHVISRLPHLSDVPYPRMVPRHQQATSPLRCALSPHGTTSSAGLPHLSDVPYPRMVPRHQQATSPLRCALSPHGTTSSAGYLTSPMCPIPAWYHVISRLPHLSDVPYPRMVPRHQQGYLTSPMCPIPAWYHVISRLPHLSDVPYPRMVPRHQQATSPLRCALSPHGTTSSAGYLTSPMCPIPAWYHVISRLPHLSDVPYPRMVPRHQQATSPLRCALSPHGTTSSAGYLTSPMCPIPAWYHVISRLPHLSDVPYPRMVPRHQQATSPLRCALSPHGTTSSAGLPHLSDVPYPRMVPRHQQATSPLRCALSPHGTTSSAGYLTSPMCPIPAWYHVISRLPHLSDVPYPRMVPRHQQATSPLRCALSPHGTTSSAGLPHLSDVPYPRMVPRHQQATSPLRCALSPHGTTSSAGYLTSPMCPIPAWYHVISRLPHLSDVPYPRMVPRHQQATSPLRCALSPHGTTSSAGYLTSPMCPIPHGTTSSAGYLTSPMCPIPAWYHVISRLPHLSDVPYPRMVPRHQQGYLTSPMCPIPAWYHVISRLPHLSDVPYPRMVPRHQQGYLTSPMCPIPAWYRHQQATSPLRCALSPHGTTSHLSDVPYPRMVPRHQQATSPLRCALSPHGTTSSAGYLTSPMCPIPAWYHVISRLPHLSDVPYPRMVPRHQQATSPLRCALSPPMCMVPRHQQATSPLRCALSPHGTTSSAGLPHLSDVPYPRMVPRHQQATSPLRCALSPHGTTS